MSRPTCRAAAEAVKQSLEKISNDEVRVRVIHAGVGAINKSDVMLANAGNAIIIGFNVRPDPVAKEEAAQAEVELRMYRVIYDAINDVTDAMKGMLAPKFREVELGRAEVRSVFKISSAGTIAGCYVLEGKVTPRREDPTGARRHRHHRGRDRQPAPLQGRREGSCPGLRVRYRP